MGLGVDDDHPVALRQGQEILVFHGLFLQAVAQDETHPKIEESQGQQGNEEIRAPQADGLDARSDQAKGGFPFNTRKPGPP